MLTKMLQCIIGNIHWTCSMCTPHTYLPNGETHQYTYVLERFLLLTQTGGYMLVIKPRDELGVINAESLNAAMGRTMYNTIIALTLVVCALNHSWLGTKGISPLTHHHVTVLYTWVGPNWLIRWMATYMIYHVTMYLHVALYVSPS